MKCLLSGDRNVGSRTKRKHERLALCHTDNTSTLFENTLSKKNRLVEMNDVVAYVKCFEIPWHDKELYKCKLMLLSNGFYNIYTAQDNPGWNASVVTDSACQKYCRYIINCRIDWSFNYLPVVLWVIRFFHRIFCSFSRQFFLTVKSRSRMSWLWNWVFPGHPSIRRTVRGSDQAGFRTPFYKPQVLIETWEKKSCPVECRDLRLVLPGDYSLLTALAQTGSRLSPSESQLRPDNTVQWWLSKPQ